MFDFGALPPEINSTRMYSGPGSGPMMAAAAGWDAIAGQLESLAVGYAETIASLQGQYWSGPATDAMAAAAAPYVAWAATTAAQAQTTAVQLRAVAAAFEAAFAATVPPAAVAANRAQLLMLVATNFFGQNGPAIAATEASYAEMWAQDATAMYAYAGATVQAHSPTSFHRPPQTTNPGGQFAQHAAVGRAAADVLAGETQFSAPDLASGALDQPQLFAANSPAPMNAGLAAATSPLEWPIIAELAVLGPTLGVLGIAQQVVFTTGSLGIFGVASLNAQVRAVEGKNPTNPILPDPVPELPQFPTAVLANSGRAVPVGRLTVPQNWLTAAQLADSADPAGLSARPASPLAGPAEPSAPLRPTGTGAPMGMAGPMGRSAVRNDGVAVYRLRDRRFRMPRPPAAG